MLKPLIATKVVNPISRGLFTAAKNSVGRVQESTQQITKGLNKDQKFPMNYVEFFGSKKTVKILRKNLKSVRDSLTSTFGFVSTLTKTVGGLFKKLGPGGLFAGLVGTIGATIFGGIFGKALLITLAGLALGGIGFFLVRNAKQFFKFLRDRISDLRPIVEDIIANFARDKLTKPGDLEQSRVLDEQVTLRANKIMEENPEINPDLAYKQALNQTINVIDNDIETLRERKRNASTSGENIADLNFAINALKRDKQYLKTGKLQSDSTNAALARNVLRSIGIDPEGGRLFSGYTGMDKEERLNRLNQIMEENDLAKLKFEVMRSTSMRGSASDDRLRFNADLLNAIEARENNRAFGVKDLASDTAFNEDLIKINSKNLKEFKETYLKNLNKSDKTKSNINVINKNNENGNTGTVSNGEKIIGDGADGGSLGFTFLSPLNEDFIFDRNSSRNIFGVHQ